MEQTSSPNTVAPQPMRTEQQPVAAMQNVAEQQVTTKPFSSGEQIGGGEGLSQPQGGPASQPFITPVANPPQIQQVAQNGGTDSSSSSSPQVANDVDVIEKEWVDKAKQIVTATHDDPHEQEKKVSELQSDYLKKRYGKELSNPKE